MNEWRNRMKKLTVDSSNGKYDIIIGSNILNETLANHLKDRRVNKAFIVTDENVEKLYKGKIEELRSNFAESVVYVIKPGEDSKNPGELINMWESMAKAGMTRKDALVAFGGGVVGDLSGFAAATYLRGIRFIQLPTTLLAQVDSSVGGKVAVDLKAGKNLAGSFYSPEIVIIDSSVLKTLTKRTFSDGVAEVIKYGFIRNPEILTMLSSLKKRLVDMKESFVDEIDEKAEISDGTLDIIEDIIYTSCSIKAQVVSEDETEQNIRAILNFGHTIGHGVEACGDYSTFTHGEAVAVGMVHAIELGRRMGITDDQSAAILDEILDSWELPKLSDFHADEMMKFISNDKKATSDGIKFIFIEYPGSVKMVKIKPDEIRGYLSGK
jgi:3-dehydroquinate synthase